MAEKAFKYARTPEAKQKCSNLYVQKTGFDSSISPADRILHLQRTAGNQAVQRLIKSSVLQAKLRISQPHDIYEQEADRVAEQVMRMPEPKIQRKCSKCKKELELLQPKAIGSITNTVPPIVHEVLSTPGQPLDTQTRAFMEPRFGYDFSKVRVHVDERAAESARAVNALAYTVGQNVVFRMGQYAPTTKSGQHILAHELVHVVQQNARSNFQMPGQIIQRLEIQDCFDQLHEDWVRYEHNLAYSMLSYGYSMGFWPSNPRVKAAFWRHFKIAPESPDFQHIYYHVLNVLYTILQASQRAVYECESNEELFTPWLEGWCGPGVIATSLTNIHLCLPWWNRLNSSLELAAATLIHEWAHKWGPGVNRIFETYCHEAEYLNMNATERIKQPDAYENYTYELWTGITSDCHG